MIINRCMSTTDQSQPDLIGLPQPIVFTYTKIAITLWVLQISTKNSVVIAETTPKQVFGALRESISLAQILPIAISDIPHKQMDEF